MHKQFFRSAITTLVCSTFLLSGCNSGSNSDNGGSSPAVDGPGQVSIPHLSFTAPGESLDLRNYTLTAQYKLPVGQGSNLLASEVSAITYNWDTDTLFMVGDSGTAIVQVSKQGQFIDSMTLPADAGKPQGTYFYDTEGLAYAGNGKFALVEERYRQINQIAYTPNTTLNPATASAVKLGTTVGNIGLEGVTYDRASGDYIFVKEKTPMGVFQSTADFVTHQASNGGPGVDNPQNLFDPALIAVPGQGTVLDLGDIYALSNVVPANSPDRDHLLLLSEESGQLLKVDRQGKVYSTRYVEIAPLHAQIEGVTLDKDLNLYLSTEQGSSGTAGNPELWVYTPTRSAASVGVSSNLYLQFDDTVTPGSGTIQLRASTGEDIFLDVNDATQVSFNGALVTLDPAMDLQPGVDYQVVFSAGVFKNATGDLPESTRDQELKFTTAASFIGLPALAAVTPENGAGNISINSPIVLQFSQAIQAGTGQIHLGNGTDDNRSFSATDPQVVITGNKLTLRLTAALKPGAQYTLSVDANALLALKDAAPIPNLASIAVSFITQGAFPPVTLNAGDLVFVAATANGVPEDAFSFMPLRALTAGTSIYFSDRDSLTATNEGVYRWTATEDLAAGTIVTIRSNIPASDIGTMTGVGGGLGASGETLFAFTGTVDNLSTAPVISHVDHFIAAINFGGAIPTIDDTLQTQLAAVPGAFLRFAELNVKYTGPLTVAEVKNNITLPEQWFKDSNKKSPFILNNQNSLFP